MKTREDDEPAVVAKRFEAYEQQTRPLLDHFRSAGYRFVEVDGSHGAPEAIASRICARIKGDSQAGLSTG